jgi:hypothetical protein
VTVPDKDSFGEHNGDKPNELDLVTLGSYGTFLYAESRTDGFYRFQTDYLPLVEYMKLRSWNSNSPWAITGWGTSYIFRRRFSRKDSATRSVIRIVCRVLELEERSEEPVFRGSEIGFRVKSKAMQRSEDKKPVSGAYWLKPPPLARKKRRCSPRI